MLNYFNTSHVTVYRFLTKTIETRKFISIHLMLLFIVNIVLDKPIHYLHFNTSHVTVYQDIGRRSAGRCIISIHLMLLFIVFGLTS